jgi:hypothetical protein
MSRITFLGRVLRDRLRQQEKSCPYCRTTTSETIGRKHLVVELRRCTNCGLMYRWPKDSVNFNHSFYQRDYREQTVTELPDGSALASLKNSLFREPNRTFPNG